MKFKRTTHRSPSLAGEGGFSMVEMVVAISLFAVTATGVAAMLGTSLRLVGTSRGRSVAANLAAQEMDVVRSTKFTALPLGTVETVQSVDGTPYTIRRESEWIDEDASTGPCDAPPGSTLSFLRVTASVSWPGMGTTVPPASQTILSPPVGTYDESSGHIAVSIVDRDGLPRSDVTVVAAGPSGTSSQVTTSDGCAFFAYRNAGSYTVTISAAGFVDTVNAPTSVQSVTVANGTTTAAEFQFDASTTLAVSLSGATIYPAAAGVPVTIANSGILPTGTATYAGTGASRSLPNLFPWADGYSVFAGGCKHADPQGESAPGTRIWGPDAVRPDPIEAVPGGTSSAVVQMPEIEVLATRTVAGVPTPVSGASVQAQHAADDGCPAGANYSLGTTNAAGVTGKGLPFGIWDVYVNGAFVQRVTLDPGGNWATPAQVAAVLP